MKTLTILRDVAAIAVLAALVLLLVDVDRTIRQVRPQVVNDLEELHRATLEIGLTSENLRKATADWQQSSQQQAAYFTAAAAQTKTDLEQLNKTLDSVNAAAVSLNKTIVDQDAQLTLTQEQTRASLAALQTSANQLGSLLENATAAVGNAAKISGDPSIPETLHQLQLVATSTAATSQNIAMTTADIRAFVHRETSPVTGTWNVIKGFLQEFAGPAAQVVTAAK